uniref:ATP synthase complex subunit 8 n=1 Tax=Aulacochilus grouvellei TaxID=2800504 RepID=A0A7T6YA05_9CUCU|nr:ATP synthase F0 subunit 8 [Aulacochilus grouvellei]QQK56315.1 ATP synthase subunit 8 [Aulacochilus grouvellei]
MPQMAPLNWLILFIYFVMIFLFINSMNYYLFYYTPKFFQINKFSHLPMLNWKW